MKRWQEDKHVMQRQSKMWLRSLHDLMHNRNDRRFHKPLGKFRKRHALDCGKPNCCLCHYSKVYKVKDCKDITNAISTREQIKEFTA